MKILNSTNHQTLSDSAKFADSFLDRLLGLHLPHNPKALVFKSRFGIHTFGLRESIDILVLNNHQRVIKLVNSLLPNRLLLYSPRYQTVIELPKDTLEKTQTKHNDKITFA